MPKSYFGKVVGGGLGGVVIVGVGSIGLALYVAHGPDQLPDDFGDINPGEHVPYTPTPGYIPVGMDDPAPEGGWGDNF